METNPKEGEISFSDGSMELVKLQGDSAMSFVMRYDGLLLEGEYYAFRYRIKTVELSGTSPKIILQAYSSNAWLKEAGRYGMYKSVTGTNDWYEMTQLIQIPAGTAKLKLCGYLPKDTLGTVYYDDFELYHVAIDPLEMVLKSPNYKGLIYGDGKADIDLDVYLRKGNWFVLFSAGGFTPELIELAKARNDIILSE